MGTTRIEFEAHKASLNAFQAGLKDGRAASLRRERLSPYLRVGLDEYAQGYRSGFFSRTAAPGASPPPDRPLSGNGTRALVSVQR
jgi:hypothetical protein